jgi:NRAMP (natural resistance-associated macrophage protein)-like metal ion transporter
MAWHKRISWRNALLILAVIGPGIITANVDNDAGGIATYSIVGAHFGYRLLWLFVPIAVTLIIVQEMAARLGVVSGKGFADLIRENFGIKVTFYLMATLLAVNLANTMAEFAGWAASMEIFGVARYIAVPVAALLVWLLVVRGRYRFVERIFLFASAVYITYIVSGLLAKPDWGKALHQTLVPSVSMGNAYLVATVALIGTTIAPWMQFYLQSAVVEKGVKTDQYPATKIDVIVGCIMANVVAVFIVVACAATLFKNGIMVESAKDAALALKPLAGKYAALLFAIGLANASLFAASILPLSTAYSVCEGMGWEGGVNTTFREAPQFNWIYTGLIVLGAGIVLIPGVPLLMILYWSQVLNGVLLPVTIAVALILVNKPEIMGDKVNSKGYNFVAWAAAAATGIASIMMVLTMVAPGLFN